MKTANPTKLAVDLAPANNHPARFIPMKTISVQFAPDSLTEFEVQITSSLRQPAPGPLQIIPTSPTGPARTIRLPLPTTEGRE
jgi:hypothetical protein